MGDRWLMLSKQEIYEVWQEVLQEMKGYPRSKVLAQLSWFSKVIIQLAGTDGSVDVVKEMLTVWLWWDVVWEKPERYEYQSLG